MAEDPSPSGTPRGISVTALYTAHTWSWGGLEEADLFTNDDTKRTFDGTNLALAIARPFQSRQVRSLRHSLLHRHTMIDHMARTSGMTQFVELAAGLSRRGACFGRDRSCTYVEVDLPQVIDYKRRLLERSEQGRDVLARPNHRLVSADVLECDLESTVFNHDGGPWFDRSKPIFVIAEGLFVYLGAAAQVALIQQVRRLLGSAGGAFLFDLVPRPEEPPPGTAGRALGWMMKRFTGGKSFEEDARTRQTIAANFSEAGFEVEILEPETVASAWNLPFPNVPTRVVLFLGRVSDPR